MDEETVKPSWQSMEFWGMLGINAIGLLVLLGWLGSAEKDTAQTIFNNVLRDIFALISSAAAFWKFAHTRQVVKSSANQAIVTTNEVRLASMSMPSSRLMAMLLVGLFLCGSASAQTIKLAPGTWYGTGKVIITVNAQGQMSVALDSTGPVTITGTTPTTNPTDPNPTPGDLNPFGQEVARLTRLALQNGGTPTAAAGISAVYSLVADSVGKGDILPADAFTAVNFGVARILSEQANQAAWADLKTGLANMFDRLRQDGSLNTNREPDPGKYKAALAQVAKGMNSVTGFNGSLTNPQQTGNADEGILGNIDIEKIMQWIKLFMELFKMFSPK